MTMAMAIVFLLQIENVGYGDSGQYQCQVNTDTTLSVTLVLTILGQRKYLEFTLKYFN